MNVNTNCTACGDRFQQQQTRNQQDGGGGGPIVDCRPLLSRVCSHTPYCMDCFQNLCASNIHTRLRFYKCPLCRLQGAFDKNNPVVNEIMCAFLGAISNGGSNHNHSDEEDVAPDTNREEERDPPLIPPVQLLHPAWNANEAGSSEERNNLASASPQQQDIPDTSSGQTTLNPSPTSRNQPPLEALRPKRQRMPPAYYGRSSPRSNDMMAPDNESEEEIEQSSLQRNDASVPAPPTPNVATRSVPANAQTSTPSDQEHTPCTPATEPSLLPDAPTETATEGTEQTDDGEPKIVKKEKDVILNEAVLLSRQSREGMLKLGGGNCGMRLYPSGNTEANINHPRFAAIGDRQAIAYNDCWNAFGPKYAGQQTAHLSCCSYAAPFSVFVKRAVKSNTWGWEYCGEYRAADSEREIIAFNAAWSLKSSDRKKMAGDITRSLKNPSGAWHNEVTQRRAEYKDVLAADKTPASPQWMVEKRRPTEAEQKQKPAPLAARLRALGYHNDIPDSEIGHVMISLDDFHETIGVIFVEYDETMYNFLRDGETTRSATGTTRHGSEACAKASDWYAWFDQQV